MDGASTTPPPAAAQVEVVPIGAAITGMLLAEPVHAPWTGAPLLAGGTRLSLRHLELLRRAGVEEIRVVGAGAGAAAGTGGGGSDARAIRPATAGSAEAPASSAGGGHDCSEILGRFIRASGPSVSASRWAASRTVGRHAEEMLDGAVDRLVGSAPARDLILAHGLEPSFLVPAMDGAALCTIVATALGWDDRRIGGAAVAAFLADIGMVMIPREILEKPGILDAREKAEVERHTTIGAQLLRPLSRSLSALPRRVAREHHERVDGTGYPSGRFGDEICDEAQLVALAHLYLAAIRGRSYRPALPPGEAMELVAGVAGAAVREDLVEAFADAVALYPIDSTVRLGTGQCGRVIAGGDIHGTLVLVEWGIDGRRIPPFETVVGSGPGLNVVACAA